MGDKKLTEHQKAEIMLEHLSEFINIDWNLEEYFLKAIKNGLREIKENEKADQDGRPNQQ
jgi:hypothetical protein